MNGISKNYDVVCLFVKRSESVPCKFIYFYSMMFKKVNDSTEHHLGFYLFESVEGIVKKNNR